MTYLTSWRLRDHEKVGVRGGRTIRLLSSILSNAVDQGIVEKNPALGVKLALTKCSRDDLWRGGGTRAESASC